MPVSNVWYMIFIRTRRVDDLNADGCQKSSMTARESFACYRDGDGNVIALDKTGFCVTE